MLPIKLLATLYLSIHLAGNAEANETTLDSARIIGGTQVGIYSPFIARIENVLDHRTVGVGTGTILSNRWILTAASLIIGQDPDLLTFRVGTFDLSLSPGTLYSIESYRVHEQYRSTGTPTNNIALLRSSQPIEFNARVGSIDYLNAPKVDADVSVVMNGWGLNTFLGTLLPRKLQALATRTLSNDRCQLLWSKITNAEICTRRRYFSGICSGDEGGPVTNVEGTVLLAINSVSGRTSSGCGYEGSVNIHTRVSEFITWIHEKMAATLDVRQDDL